MQIRTTALGAHNPLLQQIRRAAKAGSPTADGMVLAEGWNLFEEALRSHISITSIISTEASLPEVRERYKRYAIPLPSNTRFFVTDSLNFEKISATGSPQPILALVEMPVWSAKSFRPGLPILVLDRLQDPGNAGALVRSAEAFGAGGVVFLPGCASPLHPKTLRASAGSLFRLPFVYGQSWQALSNHLPAPYFGLMAGGDTSVERAPLSAACTLVVGNEGAGLAEELRQQVQPLSIPTSGVESLNAGVAAAICLYEAARQRRQPHPPA